MRELILINISGHDKPAVTSAVTRILAQNGANVLDIGQAVIHDQLSLGMLVEFNSGSNAEPVLAAIEAKMAELEMRVRFNPIDKGSYQGWVQQQGKPRHIVTLLARHITAEQIAELTHVVAAHGLNIDNISRLSGRVSLEHDNDKTKACVEFSARGTPADISQLRADFADLASKLDVDIAFQQDNMFRRTRRLVCFDMDSTLIEAEVIDELAKVPVWATR